MPEPSRIDSLIVALFLFCAIASTSVARIHVWDTQSPDVDAIDLGDRAGWADVPGNAAPGYRPRGHIVVENEHVSAVFRSDQGVAVHSRNGSRRVRLGPFRAKTASMVVRNILRSADGAVTVEVEYSDPGAKERVAFEFTDDCVLKVTPGASGIRLLADIEYVVAPDFLTDDLVFVPDEYGVETLHVPSSGKVLLGLLRGGDGMLVAAWPDVGRKASLTLGAAESRERQATSMDIGAGGRPIHVALLDTPGIWHRETFTSAYVERDVASDWQRPFRAKWTTQLVEDRVKTTFRFLEAKRGRMWRAGIGTYAYPAWFDGDRAMFHLGKRIPAKGFSLVYCLESDGDPVEAARTPADVLRRALDEAAYVGEMDVDGRVMRPAYRPNTVVATATCGVTDRLKPIFAEGQQREKIEYIQAGIEDMMSHLVVLAERADEYRAFVDEMTEYLSASRADRPEMDAYLGEMADITSRMSDVFDHHRENIRDLAYARELGIRTVALAQSVDADVDALSEFMKLKNEWTGMGGSLETLMRQLHTTARKLFQEAGYRSAPDRRAIPFAEEIRRRTKALLREPREYEIWSDY